MAAGRPGPAAASDDAQFGSYELRVNGRALAGAPFAERTGTGALWVEESALKRLRVETADLPVRERDGIRLVEVSAVKGVGIAFDESRQAFDITLPPDRLAGSVLDARPQATVPKLASRWGGFANYALYGYIADQGSSQGSGLFELGAFGPLGTGIANFAANTSTASGTTHQFLRLDTYWRVDDPGRQRTLIVGDSVTRPGFIGRSVRFGGVQYGTNFSLQPGFVSYPLQAFSGVAVVPSTVDVLVNNNRILSRPVEPGPFEITNVPSVNGAGELQLVVKDMFGREQVVTQPMYGSTRLLAAGLDDFTVSAGAVRQNYGIQSFDYGSFAAGGTWRRGLTNALTLEGRAEVGSAVRSVGAAAEFLVGQFGVATLGAAGSSGDAGSGALGLAGFEYTSRRFGIGLRSTYTGSGFRQLGDNGTIPPKLLMGANAGVNLGGWGSLGAALVSQSYRDGRPDFLSATLTYTRAIAAGAYVAVSASRTQSSQDSTTLLASLVIPIGGGANASGSVSQTRNGNSSTTLASASIQKPLPTYGEGYGYRLYQDTERRTEAGFAANLPMVRVGLDVANTRDQVAGRVLLEGGIGAVGGYAFASRPILESFGVVTTGGVGGVRVLQENQPVGPTNEKGYIVLPRMIAYGLNHVSIDPLSAPMGVSLGDVKTVAIPAWRSGELIEFDVVRERNVVVRIVRTDGSPVPAGSELTVAGVPGRMTVGYDGEAFVSGMPETGGRATVRTGNTSCTFEVPAHQNGGVPRIGPLVCVGPKP